MHITWSFDDKWALLCTVYLQYTYQRAVSCEKCVTQFDGQFCIKNVLGHAFHISSRFFLNKESHYERLTRAFPFTVCSIGCRWTWIWRTVGIRLTEENRGALEWSPLRFFFAYRKSYINCPIIPCAQQTKYLKSSKWMWTSKRTIVLTFCFAILNRRMYWEKQLSPVHVFLRKRYVYWCLFNGFVA